MSDPPDCHFYYHKMNNDDTIATDRNGLYLYSCNRGTNDVENVHKQLRTCFGRWTCGIETADCLLMWFRHRFNHRASERNRADFLRIGHYDTWIIDELQILVMKNHGVRLYTGWVNSTERFGTIPIHSRSIDAKLKTKFWWKGPFKLSRDQQYLARKTGVPIPFLPVTSPAEIAVFKTLVEPLERGKIDWEQIALQWVDHVDLEKDIFPKLPVHLRKYVKKHTRNTNCAAAAEKNKESTKAVYDHLDESNLRVLEETSTGDDNFVQQEQQRAHIAQIHAPELSGENSTCFVGTFSAGQSFPNVLKRGDGKRSKDKKNRKKPTCQLCTKYGGKGWQDRSKCKGNVASPANDGR